MHPKRSGEVAQYAWIVRSECGCGLGSASLRRHERMAAAQSIALFCGFRAFLILRGHYPPVFARGIHPFVDLLLTRRWERKRPPLGAALERLFSLYKTGCGGRI